MQYLLTEEEHRELQRKASLVNIYAEEIKRLAGIPTTAQFSEYAKRLIADRVKENKEKYYNGS